MRELLFLLQRRLEAPALGARADAMLLAAEHATGNFCAEQAPQVTLRRPGRHWHPSKVTFEKYWLRRWFR